MKYAIHSEHEESMGGGSCSATVEIDETTDHDAVTDALKVAFASIWNTSPPMVNVSMAKREKRVECIVDFVPDTHPVQPLHNDDPAKDRCTCGACGLSWDDGKSTSMTPTPSGRCPFEAFHEYEEVEE